MDKYTWRRFKQKWFSRNRFRGNRWEFYNPDDWRKEKDGNYTLIAKTPIHTKPFPDKID